MTIMLLLASFADQKVTAAYGRVISTKIIAPHAAQFTKIGKTMARDQRKEAFKNVFNEIKSENGDWADFVIEAESVIPGLCDLIEGKAVIMPVEAIDEINDALYARADWYPPLGVRKMNYADQLAASPYRTNPHE
jgi:hypothetical protein